MSILGRILLGKSSDSKGLTPWRMFYLFVVYFVAPVGGFHLYCRLSVEQIADFMLSDYAEDASITYQPFYTWSGDFGVRNLRIQPDDTSVPATTVDEIRLVTPGWRWTLDLFNPPDDRKKLHNPFSRAGRRGAAVEALGGLFGSNEPEEIIPPSRHLALEMTDVKVSFNDFLPSALNKFGWVSAMPFETEGCVGDAYWSAEDVTLMGLSYPGSNVHWDFDVPTPNRLETTARIESPGIGMSEVTAIVELANADHVMTMGQADAKMLETRYHFVDHGFNAARNKYCASRDHVTTSEFMQRHLASVKRLLAKQGFDPPPEVEQRYQRFAEKGGELTVDAHPDTSIPMSAYKQYSPDARMRLMNATLEVSDLPKIPLTMNAVAARAMPEDFNGSTWDLVARERGLAVQTTSSGKARPVLPEASAKGSTASAAPPQQMDSKVAPEDDFADDPASQKHANDIPFADLKNYIGHSVRVELETGHRSGVLESATPGAIVVRVRAVSGQASLTFTRQSVQRVIRLN